MQAAELFILPQKVKRAKARQKKPTLTERASEQPEISGTLDQFSSLTLATDSDPKRRDCTVERISEPLSLSWLQKAY